MSTLPLLTASYLVLGAAAGVWWLYSTENTGSSRESRLTQAFIVGVLWLPFLLFLYLLRFIAWVGRDR